MRISCVPRCCVSTACSVHPTEKRNVGEGGENPNLQTPKRSRQLNLLKSLAPPLVAALVAFNPLFTPPGNCAPVLLANVLPGITSVSLGQTIDVQKGASLFNRACIGCHTAGGNIIQPGATLFLKDLQRNGVDTEEEIYRVTYYGKGRMPGFGEECTPRGQCTFGPRLQEDEIKLLAEFVKSQADQGWPNGESGGN